MADECAPVVSEKEGRSLRQRLAEAQQQLILAMQEEADLGRQLADSEADLERQLADLKKQLADSEANLGKQLADLQKQLAEAIQAKHDLQRQALETERSFQHQMEEEKLRHKAEHQKQLTEAIQAKHDLQRQASETERSLQHQMEEEMLRHRDEISQLRSQVQSQATSRELEFWNVPRGDVEIDSEIGVGGWGSISKGMFRGQTIAVKRLHPSIVSKDNISRLRREVHLMAHVRHPNLLLFIAAVFDEKIDHQHPPLIILELLEIDLRRAYEDDRVSSKESDLLPIFRDVACALNYLHCLREPIIHRDLSAPNVLLEAMANNRWKAKVSDFGSANLKKLAQTAAEGAILYSAPECLPKELRGPHAPNFPQTPKIDVYSYGVLLCEVIARTLPEELGPLREKLKSMWPFMHSLVKMCTEYDPSERPTVSRILTELNRLGMTRPVEDHNPPHQTQSPPGSDLAGGPSSGQPQHQQRAGQPPPQQQQQPAGSSHQSHGQQMPPIYHTHASSNGRAIAHTPDVYNPVLVPGIGSMVQVSDPPLYGVLRWIGELPDVKGAIAGVEMVSFLLQF